MAKYADASVEMCFGCEKCKDLKGVPLEKRPCFEPVLSDTFSRYLPKGHQEPLCEGCLNYEMPTVPMIDGKRRTPVTIL